MLKKKVLIHGSLDSLTAFLQSSFHDEYKILALISEDFDKFDAVSPSGELELIPLRNVNKFVYEIVDGIVLTDKHNRQASIKYFIAQGAAPHKIILWDERHPSNLNTGLAIQNPPDSPQISRYKSWIEAQYKYVTGKNINWNNPETFTEKIQWLKLYDSTPLKTRLADKYLVRRWVAEKIGDAYLIPLLGVWDKFDDIDFDLLPNQFVLKCNHGSAMNIIVRDKKLLDIEDARQKINAWLDKDFGFVAGEFHYSYIDKKIIAEKFLTDENAEINDYKFWCFDGQVRYVQVDRNRSTNHVQRFYSVNWEPFSFIIATHTLDEEILEQPPTLEEMLQTAETLSVGFNIVRVDLYCVGNKIYFGEMTFTPLSGYLKWTPDYMDRKIGSLINLR